VKYFIDVGAGVVDYDYRGNVGVVLFNHGDQDFAVVRGDRVAQLVLERISMAPAVEVQELSDTTRGSGGFGSTGVAAQTAI
jgi:dUTP pyrophosphatase